MSAGGTVSDTQVTAVLLALWRRGEMEAAELIRETRLNLPRVHEALDLLVQRKCLIERTPAGVRLVSTGLACWGDLLEEQARRENLRIARRVMPFHRTTSTNDVAWQCVSGGGAAENDGLVIVADEQTAGRGRLGHTWTARPEQSILLSVLLCAPATRRPEGENEGASVDRFTLLAGLAVARAIEAAMNQVAGSRLPRIEIKWPNDLLVGGRKLAGILVERRGARIVIGIGINVAQAAQDFPPEIAGRAISLYQASGLLIDRLRVVSALVRELDHYGHASIDDDAWLAEWKSRCGMLGSRIRARTGNRVITGQVLDVAPFQGLLLRDDSGVTHLLSSRTTTLEATSVR